MNSNNNKKPVGSDYIKYSGIAFQMIAIILVFTYGGFWLDGKIELKIPVFTILGILIGIALSLYQILRSLK
jgi:ATP synthase protein I